MHPHAGDAPAAITPTIRPASFDDVPELEQLIAESVRGLASGDYSKAQIEAALGTAWGVDSELIRDGTYFVVEAKGKIVGCGGWGKRKTLFGGNRQSGRESTLLDPAVDSARVRAFFVHPTWARRGIGRMLLQRCEDEARVAGFGRAELLATLPGHCLYRACGYAGDEARKYPLPDGPAIDFVPMRKMLIGKPPIK